MYKIMSENVSTKRHRMTATSFSNQLHYHLFIMSIVLYASSLVTIVLGSSICTHHEYWDSNMEECVPCTKCNKHQIVIRPCQRHLDTVCRPINSVDIDWSKSMLMATDRTTLEKEHHRIMSTMESFSAEEATASREEELLLWDWQLITLILAIIACLLFFIVTTIISINYVRQWRKIKKEFDTDIEHLSQQLMARLASPPTESATIFLDDPTSRNNCLGSRQIEVRCVYLEDLLAGKESLKDPKGSIRVSNSPAGNVYIEDNEKRHIIVGHKLV